MEQTARKPSKRTGMVVFAYGPSTPKAEAGGWLESKNLRPGSKQQDIVYMIEQGPGRDLVRKMLAACEWEPGFLSPELLERLRVMVCTSDPSLGLVACVWRW